MQYNYNLKVKIFH